MNQDTEKHAVPDESDVTLAAPVAGEETHEPEVKSELEAIPLVFTLGEAAGLLQVHKETLRKAIKKNKLAAAKVGREFRISRLDLERYWAECGGVDLFERTMEPRLPEPETAADKEAEKDPGPEQLSLF